MSNKSCAILQPHYIPWIGYFEMINRVDVFLFHDDIDFIKGEWKNRNRIRKSPYSLDTKWLTIPITKNCLHNTLIVDVVIDNAQEWSCKHLRHIHESYNRTPFYSEAIDLLKNTYNKQFSSLADLNISLIEVLCDYLEINTQLLRVSELNLSGKKDTKLVNICKTIGADFYLANNGSSNYLDIEYFERHGICCQYQNYAHPVYPQYYKHNDISFLPYLSIIDLICNHGRASLEVITRGQVK